MFDFRLRYTFPASLTTFVILFYGYYEAWTQ